MPGKEAGRPVTVTLMRQLSDLPCGIVLGGKGNQPAPLGMGLAIPPAQVFLASQMRVQFRCCALAESGNRRCASECGRRLVRGAGRGEGSFGLVGEMAS